MAVYTYIARVFFNEDCGQYGVEKLVKGMTLCSGGVRRQLYKWQQVDPSPAHPSRSAYTPYRAVAERWAKKLNEGTVSIHVDME